MVSARDDRSTCDWLRWYGCVVSAHGGIGCVSASVSKYGDWLDSVLLSGCRSVVVVVLSAWLGTSAAFALSYFCWTSWCKHN